MTSKSTQGPSKSGQQDKTNQGSNRQAASVDLGSEVVEEKNATVSQDKPTSETGGPKGPEPTRYGDWEQKGRCTDF